MGRPCCLFCLKECMVTKTKRARKSSKIWIWWRKKSCRATKFLTTKFSEEARQVRLVVGGGGGGGVIILFE